MLNRRNFLKGAAVAGGLMVLPSWSIAKTPGPNSKLRVAVVGVGGRGDAVISAFRNFAMLTIPWRQKHTKNFPPYRASATSA